MPDYKIYVPEAKAPILYQFKEQFGKDASGMIADFIETSVMDAGTREQDLFPTDEIYDIYFGDIESEKACLYLFETRESAKLAIKNRLDALYQKHPDLYLDVIAQFKEKYPNLAKITGINQ